MQFASAAVLSDARNPFSLLLRKFNIDRKPKGRSACSCPGVGCDAKAIDSVTVVCKMEETGERARRMGEERSSVLREREMYP